MSFSYSETLATDLDYVRFRLGEDSEDDAICSDELITAAISLYSVEGALVTLCNKIKLFYGKEPDRIGLSNGRSFSFKDRYEAYSDLYDELLAEFHAVVAVGSDATGLNPHSGLLDFPLDVEIDYLPYQGIESKWNRLGCDSPSNIYPNEWFGALGTGRF